MTAATTIYLIVIAVLLLIEIYVAYEVQETASRHEDVSFTQRMVIGATAIFASMISAVLILKWMKNNPEDQVVAVIMGMIVPFGVFTVVFLAIASIAGVDIGQLF